MAILRRVLERKPDDTEALFNLGMALGDRQEHGESLALLSKVVTLEPAYSGTLLALGVAYARSGDWT